MSLIYILIASGLAFQQDLYWPDLFSIVQAVFLVTPGSHHSRVNEDGVHLD